MKKVKLLLQLKYFYSLNCIVHTKMAYYIEQNQHVYNTSNKICNRLKLLRKKIY